MIYCVVISRVPLLGCLLNDKGPRSCLVLRSCMFPDLSSLHGTKVKYEWAEKNTSRHRLATPPQEVLVRHSKVISPDDFQHISSAHEELSHFPRAVRAGLCEVKRVRRAGHHAPARHAAAERGASLDRGNMQGEPVLHAHRRDLRVVQPSRVSAACVVRPCVCSSMYFYIEQQRRRLAGCISTGLSSAPSCAGRVVKATNHWFSRIQMMPFLFAYRWV